MKRKILGILGVILVVAMSLLSVQGVSADRPPEEPSGGGTSSGGTTGGSGSATTGGSSPAPAGACGGSFLGFKPWYDGLCFNNGGQAEIVPVCEKDSCPSNAVDLNVFVWTIVLNVLFDLGLAVGVIALAMVIYSGYMYITSQGDVGRLAKAKKSLMSAIIGVVVAMGATVIVNTFKVILGIQNHGWNTGVATQETVANAFNWAYAAAGLVAVVFIIKGGIDYLLSAGDPGKVKKATQSLIFAVVGLVLVLVAAVITNFVISSVGGALE